MGSPSREAGASAPGGKGIRVSRRELLAVAGFGLVAGAPRAAAAKPNGQLAWGIHTTLAPTWFDPADPRHVRFRLKQAWPDFITFYTTASGAGWIVPKKYVEKVGEDGFKKAPVGAGPYKFVSFDPGVELVMEASETYWRKTPSVKRLVFKVITDESTRLAALKRNEVDVVYSIRGELAEELQRTPGLALKPTVIQAPQWVSMLDQWDPKSPWHDRRVRLAANLAVDRKALNQADTLGPSWLSYRYHPNHIAFLC